MDDQLNYLECIKIHEILKFTGPDRYFVMAEGLIKVSDMTVNDIKILFNNLDRNMISKIKRCLSFRNLNIIHHMITCIIPVYTKAELFKRRNKSMQKIVIELSDGQYGDLMRLLSQSQISNLGIDEAQKQLFIGALNAARAGSFTWDFGEED